MQLKWTHFPMWKYIYSLFIANLCNSHLCFSCQSHWTNSVNSWLISSCTVTHTSLFYLPGCSKCSVHLLPSSSECTPCFRVRSKIWWVEMCQTYSESEVTKQPAVSHFHSIESLRILLWNLKKAIIHPKILWFVFHV